MKTIIAVHPIQKKLFELIANNEIEFEGKTLRDLANMINEKASPQKVKHHLLQLVKYGYIDVVNGKYKIGKDFVSQT